MIFKIIKYSLIVSSSVFLFKYFYDKLLEDEVYLESLSNEFGENNTEKDIEFLLERAKKLEESNYYDNASDCYVSLVNDYCLDVQTVNLLIQKEETKIMFFNKLK